MRINQISITIKYKPINELQKNYYDKRVLLENDFCPATVFPIPDDAFPEFPRLLVKSKNGYSEISISKVALTFSINKLDNGYESSWDKCTTYVCEKMKVVSTFLKNIINDDDTISFCGLVVDLSYDVNNNVCSTLSKNLLKNNLKDLYDVNVRYTFVEGKKYFINIQLQNRRLYANANQEEAGGLSEKNQKSEMVGAIIDVNDRFAFNNEKSYISSTDIIEKLIQKANKIINEKLKSLINGGDYNNEQ